VPLTPGPKLGHYEILARLGAGGMGEVDRARDPRLGREVAGKVLAAGLADALDCAHRAGIVNRDLESANVMLARSGAKRMDFGRARLSGDDASRLALVTHWTGD